MLLKSGDQYHNLGHMREAAKRHYDCGKVNHGDIFFDEVYKTAYLLYMFDWCDNSLLSDVPLEVAFAYVEKGFFHAHGRVGDWSSVANIPCNQIASSCGGVSEIPITFLEGES